MSFEPHDDDVVSMEPNMSLIGNRTFKVNEFAQGLKDRLGSSALNAWIGGGVECEFLDVSAGGGWKKGKIRIRFEFVPDVLDEPEPEPSSSDLVLSPNSEQQQ